MRRSLLIAFSIVVLAVLDYGVYDKERVVRAGEVVLLRLAPVDPRSLMQGDYMRLRYAIERDIDAALGDAAPRRGEAVIAIDSERVARFVRVHRGEALGPGERLVRFHRSRLRGVRVVPDSFLFQEGHAEHYAGAAYGVFKFAGASDRVLVGLADAERERIEPAAPAKRND